MGRVATEDRRVRRTKAALQRAIVELTLDKGFHAVTGDDIAERADVTRASFYKHYENKEHLLADAVDAFATEVIAVFERRDDVPRLGGRVATLIDQSRRHRDLAQIILSGEGDGVALRRFTHVIEAIIHDDIEAGLISVVDPEVNVALMTKMRAAQIVAGVRHALEVDDDTTELAPQIVSIIDRGWCRHDTPHTSKG